MLLVGFSFFLGFFGVNPGRFTHWEVNQDGVQPTAAGKKSAPPDRGSHGSGQQGEWFPPQTNRGKQADSTRERIQKPTTTYLLGPRRAQRESPCL